MPTSRRPSIILIHGAWHASWCWQRISKQLRAQGLHVLTPDLPGHGAKIRAANTVSFADYVNCIIELIKQQPDPVTLVGHSMAGLIISQIAEMIPKHVHELVYIAAYIPKDQQSLLSIAKTAASHRVSPFLITDPIKQEIQLKSSSKLSSIFFNCCNQNDTQYAMKHLQPQPLQPFTEQITVGTNFNSVAKRSLICRYDRALLVTDQFNMSSYVTDNIHYLEADHAAYYSAENEIVQALCYTSSRT